MIISSNMYDWYISLEEIVYD
jgi:hypothetical protein